jgi:hypothetical protein
LNSPAEIPEWQRDHGYAGARRALEDLIFDYFDLSASDRLMVRDIVEFIAGSIQPADYAQLATPLLHRPSANEVAAYLDILASELEGLRRRSNGQGGLSVEGVVDGTNGFFGAVKVSLNGRGRNTTGLVRSEFAFQGLLADIEAGLANQIDRTDQDNLFKIPNVVIIVDDTFYFIKPMRRRFWLSRTALADADHIAQTVQAAAWEKGHS